MKEREGGRDGGRKKKREVRMKGGRVRERMEGGRNGVRKGKEGRDRERGKALTHGIKTKNTPK